MNDLVLTRYCSSLAPSSPHIRNERSSLTPDAHQPHHRSTTGAAPQSSTRDNAWMSRCDVRPKECLVVLHGIRCGRTYNVCQQTPRGEKIPIVHLQCELEPSQGEVIVTRQINFGL